jgi:hypothetical protein
MLGQAREKNAKASSEPQRRARAANPSTTRHEAGAAASRRSNSSANAADRPKRPAVVARVGIGRLPIDRRQD